MKGNTPYRNSISPDQESAYPGDRLLEKRIKNIIRWNSLAMVVRANRKNPGLGGHLSTYASAATLYEVGFNHFFRAPGADFSGDSVYFQGHASPGIYSRAFLEGRITENELSHFRRELSISGGLSSYPHPRLMPDFWQFPTVSMGLGPLMGIHQARLYRYMENRKLKKEEDAKIWVFLGDGETDEPEATGALSLAARENLDNLIFVVNCNLQRLDGPVRGNGNIIQELESIFHGYGWNVIKVVWGRGWDPLLEADTSGKLQQRMDETVDGAYQKYSISDGAYIRKNFFGGSPELESLVSGMSDKDLTRLGRGGHDPVRVHAAYKQAMDHRGSPTVILAATIKGYGLGDGGEGKNSTHQKKLMDDGELLEFAERFKIPVFPEDLDRIPFYRPPESSEEMQYLFERRRALGGFLPVRQTSNKKMTFPDSLFDEFQTGTKDRAVSTTMAYARILTKLLADPDHGQRIVPIIPDEARTFGMDPLFKQVGIYSSQGQLYEPVDFANLIYYRESRDGQILEEGINEAGSMGSFIAAGSSGSTNGNPLIPFYTYYSMFGPQRVGDLIWAAADSRVRGFLMGATSGRTTLNGEGLQHQDGQSHLFLSTVPSCISYDPAFAYELALIVQDGLDRMFQKNQEIFYYISVYNENYPMPPMPEGVEEGILRGIYRLRKSGKRKFNGSAHILAAGPSVIQAMEAAEILEDHYGIATHIWSVTSFTELRRDALRSERQRMLHPTKNQRSYLEKTLEKEQGVFVGVSDHVRSVPDGIARWIPGPYYSVGTDGFGRSDTRSSLRNFFEVDAAHIAFYALSGLFRKGDVSKDTVLRAMDELKIDTGTQDPMDR